MNKSIFSIDEILDWTFPGITVLVRDCDISPQLASLYKVGQIIRSENFVDSSHVIGKQLKNTRFLIFSSKSANFYKVQSGNLNYPLNTININSFFKVLDICNFNYKQQISLLHIPINGVSIFEDNQHTFMFEGFGDDIENYLIQKAREKIYTSEREKVINELEEEEWLRRTNWPIGINRQGILNPLRPNFFLSETDLQTSDLIKKITEDNFANQELSSFSFHLESKVQEMSNGIEQEIIYDNYSVFFSPNPNKENKFIINASKLISREGIRQVQIAEKELEITDVKPEKLTLTKQLPNTNIIIFTLNIFLFSGEVDHIIIEKFETVNNDKIQTVFRF